MSTLVIPKPALNKLKCTNCNRYISLGPVKNIPSGFLCGRCPTDGDEHLSIVTIYETVAQHIQFPCIYDEHGCPQTFPFGDQMKDHELSCSYTPNFCPMGYLENCEWKGQDKSMLEHVKNIHPLTVLDDLNVKVNLQAKIEKRYIFTSKDVVYVMDLFYCVKKGLSLEIMQRFTTDVKIASKTFDILLRPTDKTSPTLTLTRAISEYTFAISAFKTPDDVIESSLLQHLDKNEVNVSVILKWDKTSAKDRQLRQCVDKNKVNNLPAKKESTKDRNCMFRACKNFKLGCSFNGNGLNVEEHEKRCMVTYCPMKSNNCTWKGMKDKLHSHCIGHRNVCTKYEYKLSGLIFTHKTTPHFFLFAFFPCGVTLVFCVGILFDESKQVMYLSLQNVGQLSSTNINYMVAKFCNSVGNTSIRIACKPLTNSENAFDDCTSISYEHLLDSTFSLSYGDNM